MKKVMMFLASVGVVLSLSGCGGGGGGDYYEEPINDGLTTLFLIDQNSIPYVGVPYICDSMSVWNYTTSEGEFSFYPGESCDFDFDGLYGNYDDDPYVDDIVYIVDDLDYGKGGIPYECDSFIGVNTTSNEGSFYYDENDACTFHLVP